MERSACLVCTAVVREDSGDGSPPAEPAPASDPRYSDPRLKGSGPPLIFVSDASAEAERLTKALRERGYLVVDVPLSMLVSRVAVQRPALILCDVDANAALETTHRLRDVPGGSGVDLIFLGESGKTLSEMADAVIHESSGFFIRPVDTYALVRKVEALIGSPAGPLASSRPPASQRDRAISSSPPITAPPLSPPRAYPSHSFPPHAAQRPLVTPSVPPPSSPDLTPDSRRGYGLRGPVSPRLDGGELSPRSAHPDPGVVSFSEPNFALPSSHPPGSSQHPGSHVPSLPPPVPLGISLDADPLESSKPAVTHAAMSQSLERLLARAEQRVAQSPPSPDPTSSSPPIRLTPEEEVDAVLPPDVLAALDDALDEQSEIDDESSAGSRAPQGTRSGSDQLSRRDTGEGAEPAVSKAEPAYPPGHFATEATTGALAPGLRGSDRPALFSDGHTSGLGDRYPAPSSSSGGSISGGSAPEGSHDLTSARGVTTTGLIAPPLASRGRPESSQHATTPPPPRMRESALPDAYADRPDLSQMLTGGFTSELSAPRVPTWDAEPSPEQGADLALSVGPSTTAEPNWAPLSANQAPTVPPRPMAENEPESLRPTPPPRFGQREASPTTSRNVRSPQTAAEDRRDPASGDHDDAWGERGTSARHDEAAAPDAAPQAVPAFPEVLRDGDSIRALSAAVRSRFSGAIAFENDAGIRRVVLRDGDFVTAASSIHAETLLAFLVKRGTLAADIASQLARRLPPFGRHAGAALIAHGHLRQDDLWPVLRSHAEWVLSHIALMDRGSAELEVNVPGRLEAEPAVFGGATGAEVLVEVVRRATPPLEAIRRLGGLDARLAPGANPELLSECALDERETLLVTRSHSNSLRDVLGGSDPHDHAFAPVLWALMSLGVLDSLGPVRRTERPAADAAPDRLDDDAIRARVVARRRLVDEADYFALLGLTRDATAYDIRRAYLELRREFEPSRILSARTADLSDDLALVIEVLDEAYDVLRDDVRRERYRRAILATPAG